MADATKYFGTVAKNIRNQIKEAERELLKDMKDDTDLLVPHDTGMTRFTDTFIDFKKKSVMWTNEYIEFIYFGLKFMFQTNKNPRAGALWIERSISKNITHWEDKYVDTIESVF